MECREGWENEEKSLATLLGHYPKANPNGER